MERNDGAADILLDIAQSTYGAVVAAGKVHIQKENFKKYSIFLEKTAIFLRKLSEFKVQNLDSFDSAIANLKQEIKFAKHLSAECSKRNKIYLLLSCRRIAKEIEKSTNNIGRVMSIFCLGTLEVSSETKDQILNLCKDMENTQYQVPAIEEEILQKIETGIEERNVDSSYASDLLNGICGYIGISNENEELKIVFKNFKDEIDSLESRAEALWMEQIIVLLGNADIVTTPKEKKIKYFTKRDSLGRQQLEPLQSFYCPITGDVMVDPVETFSGQTFEREAIEKWLEEGNHFCPLTKTSLSKSSLRPNRRLRESIEEWRKRNIMIRIASMKSEIQSSDEMEQLNALKKLHGYCIMSELHREWIVMEDYIPILASLLSLKSSEFRVHSLAILYSLAKDGDDNKERIGNVNHCIKYIVRSLARKVDESILALQLLLELSKSRFVNLIGSERGCILLLVTLASSDDTRALEHAKKILDNLAHLDQNVIQMARAKYFEPLLQRLCEGPTSMQVIMAETLGEIELTDHNKLCLSREGVLKPLLNMLHNSDIDVNKAAVKALQNLSGVAQNGLQLIKEGAKDPLFELLFNHNLSFPDFRENVAKTIMHLAISTTTQKAFEDQISLLESEEDVFKLFSLISLTEPDMQQTLLLTFQALCKSSSGFAVRTNLRQICAVKVLIQLWEFEDLSLRENSVKLFYNLIQDGGHSTFSEHTNKKCISTLVTIIRSPTNEEELSAAVGIISRLPHDPQTYQNLLELGALKAVIDCLACRSTHASDKKGIIENATESLCRFTVPSNLECQKKVAESGIIPDLVSLLESGTSCTKQNVAITLKQLSENTSKLTFMDKKSPFFSCCLKSPETTCPLHGGICTIESSFCLLEARAVRPLLLVMDESDTRARESALDAILTLVVDGENLQKGSKILDEAGVVPKIIKTLDSSSSGMQEKALGALQRIFKLVEFRTKYGKSAEMFLVEITQRGSGIAKSLAARILVQLGVLHEQSTFF
ncbi:U-box domain-containing protein 44-like [Primulina eburnea]|uniref:U-box domain-containing protein 44-like n=1 Tax=Primulina eburnea TaxID=1245227 RepID=UPI003C6C3F3C